LSDAAFRSLNQQQDVCGLSVFIYLQSNLYTYRSGDNIAPSLRARRVLPHPGFPYNNKPRLLWQRRKWRRVSPNA